MGIWKLLLHTYRIYLRRLVYSLPRILSLDIYQSTNKTPTGSLQRKKVVPLPAYTMFRTLRTQHRQCSTSALGLISTSHSTTDIRHHTWQGWWRRRLCWGWSAAVRRYRIWWLTLQVGSRARCLGHVCQLMIHCLFEILAATWAGRGASLWIRNSKIK